MSEKQNTFPSAAYISRHNASQAASGAQAGGQAEKTLTFSIPGPNASGEMPLVGGLADRLKGACFAYLMAVATDRLFFIDWQYPFPIQDTLTPAGFDWATLPQTTARTHGSEKKLYLIDHAFDAEFAQVLTQGPAALETYMAADHVVVNCNLFPVESVAALAQSVDGLRNLDYQTCFQWLYQSLFRYEPSELMQKQAEVFYSFKKKHAHVVGAQFRTGKSNGLWDDPYLDSPSNLTYFMRVLRQECSQRGWSDYAVFLTTDNQQVKKRIGRYLSAERALYYAAEPMHVDRVGGAASHSALEGFQQVVLEFNLLGECDLVVYGKGAFGSTAAWAHGKEALRYFDHIGWRINLISVKKRLRRVIPSIGRLFQKKSESHT